ncbi:hypothetical protein GCM10009854_40010 [Saccharopolyspora halophila]|uniref:Uncharacterized protein n=1 Tax=Saccharopolyspora halophila TaxID=405551 RepID=A0ABN3GQ48_9PSEU
MRTPNGPDFSAIVVAISAALRTAAGPSSAISCTKPNSAGLGRVEFVSGEHPPHRVAPSRLFGEAHRRTSEGVDTPSDLQLSETRVLGRDPDVGRQQQLDPERHHPTLRGGDHGLRPGPVQPPGIAPALGQGELARSQFPAHVDHVETTGEVVAVREQHTAPQLVVQQPVGRSQLVEQLRPVRTRDSFA